MHPLFESYHARLSEDVKIDRMNILDQQLQLPAKKQYWANRLIVHKHELIDISKKINKLTKAAASAPSEFCLSDKAKATIATAGETIADLINKKKELELLIEFLEKGVKILSECTWDIKNMVAILQLEESR